MRRFGVQRCMSLVLAAVMLPSGTMSPGVCHAHAEGDRPHRHDRPHYYEANHSDQHDGHGPHDADHRHEDDSARHSHDGECTVTRAVLHVHVNLFGFEMTLPSSGQDRHEGQEKQSTGTAQFVIGPDSPAISGPHAYSLRNLLLPPTALPAGCCLSPDEHHHLVKSSEHCSIPLCDSARRERSGVLIV